MMDAAELERRARLRLRTIERRRRDARFQRVLGRFVAEGLLESNTQVAPYLEPLSVADVLWSGEVEPRFLELLPALLVKSPALFEATSLPPDLDRAVRKLRRNLEPDEFRGIPGRKLHEWLPRVGRKNAVPARLKSFRFKPADLQLLEALSDKLGVSETEVVRRGLRALLSE